MATICPLLYEPKDRPEKAKLCPNAGACKSPGMEPVGPSKAKLLVVGPGPTADDDNFGRMYSDRIGGYIRNRLREYDLLDETKLTGAVLCAPLDFEGKTRNPKQTEITACRENLLVEISDTDPDLIVLLGKPALQAFPEFKGKAIRDLRGKPIEIDNPEYGGHRTFFVMMHPNSIFHDPRNKEILQQDWEKIAHIAKEGVAAYRKRRENRDRVKTSYSEWGKPEDYPQVKAYLESLLAAPAGTWIGYDIETGAKWGGDPANPFSRDGMITTINLSSKEGEGVCFPWRHQDSPWTPGELKILHRLLEKLFLREDIGIQGHNLSFDIIHSMVREGWEFKCKLFCSMLANYLCVTSQKGQQGLSEVVPRETTMPRYWDELEEWLDTRDEWLEERHGLRLKNSYDYYRYNTNFWDFKFLLRYGARDADAAVRVGASLRAKAKERGQEKLLWEYMGCILPYVQMQINGMAVDKIRYRRVRKFLRDKVQSQLAKVLRRKPIRTYARELERSGKSLNLRSTVQLCHILYDIYGLPVIARTKNGAPSTSKDTLDQLYRENPDSPAAEVLEYKHLVHLQSGFVDPVYRNTKKDRFTQWTQPDGLVHPWFGLTGTETGRRNCRQPNTMQIPSRDAIGKRIKQMFRSKWEDGFLVSADYSQAELRVLACFSGDEGMVQAFLNDEDLHIRTAVKIFNKPADKITDEERGMAKTINFAVIYGRGAPALAATFGISVEEAEQWLEEYFRLYPGVKRWVDYQKQQLLRNGFVRTVFDFQRDLPKALADTTHKAGRRDRASALREGVNTLIQSPAAHFTMFALARFHRFLERKGWTNDVHIINEVHDCIVLDCRNLAIAVRAAKALKRCMEAFPASLPWVKVPISVDVDITTHWGEKRALLYTGGRRLPINLQYSGPRTALVYERQAA